MRCDDFFEVIGDGFEQSVACGAAEPFVEHLEVLDIDVEEFKRAVISCGDELCCGSHERTRIVKPCELVYTPLSMRKFVAFGSGAALPIGFGFRDEAHEHRLVTRAAFCRDDGLRCPLPPPADKFFTKPFLQRSARSVQPRDDRIEIPEFGEPFAVVGAYHVIQNVLEQSVERARRGGHDELVFLAVQNLIAVRFEVEFEQLVVGRLFRQRKEKGFAALVDFLGREQDAGAASRPVGFQTEYLEPAIEPLTVNDLLVERLVGFGVPRAIDAGSISAAEGLEAEIADTASGEEPFGQFVHVDDMIRMVDDIRMSAGMFRVSHSLADPLSCACPRAQSVFRIMQEYHD